MFALAGLLFGFWERNNILSDNPQFTLGYRIGSGLTVLIEFLAILFPMGGVCALGLAIFGVPVSHRLGDRAMARWSVVIALSWGGVAGGLFWVALSALFSGWFFEWPGLFLFGAIFGAPTGFWWWFFYRRVLIHRAALAD
ncbi:MAG: hypothetical protein KGJ57_13975 [Sphingomonadales bacterium]|nr:hypothetical protein [Sphingomonadales bacterium]MDE2170512.1 hypothetical protein [Sphingomonadales bacterium]